jgi:polyisoprenoid-binding protein YceI
MSSIYVVPLFVMGLFATLTPEPTHPKARALEVDASHSSVIFKVKHQNVSWFYGRFDTIKGSIILDEAKSSVSLTIDASSANTGNERRNRHLVGPDFFNTKQFPEIKFESKSVEVSKAGHLNVKGKLTIRGVTKDVNAIAKKTGEGKARGKPIVGYHCIFTIKRSDFGITYGKGSLGDDVEVTISLECKG